MEVSLATAFAAFAATSTGLATALTTGLLQLPLVQISAGSALLPIAGAITQIKISRNIFYSVGVIKIFLHHFGCTCPHLGQAGR